MSVIMKRLLLPLRLVWWMVVSSSLDLSSSMTSLGPHLTSMVGKWRKKGVLGFEKAPTLGRGPLPDLDFPPPLGGDRGAKVGCRYSSPPQPLLGAEEKYFPTNRPQSWPRQRIFFFISLTWVIGVKLSRDKFDLSRSTRQWTYFVLYTH